MIRESIEFPTEALMNRANAAAVVQVASRFEARIMIEREHKIVNAKSMLGLLSLYGDTKSPMTLLVEGEDEQQEAEAVRALVATLA